MSARILIAGGWGLVGGTIARLLRQAGHDVELVLAGRSPDAGVDLARRLDARAVRLDVADPGEALAAVGPVDLVIAALQDPDDTLLAAALTSGAGHIGIVRTVGDMATSAVIAASLARRPALMLGHWQAGVMTLTALAAAQAFADVDRVEMAALYDYADPIGPMTASDSSGFVGQALIREEGHWRNVNAAEAGRSVERDGHPPFDAMPMGVLDTPALAARTGARHVRFDLGAGTSIGSADGGPASHDLYIDLAGRDAKGAAMTRRTLVTDPAGQAHLTALGVLIGAERVLGLDGAAPPPAGLTFPEAVIDPAQAVARLRAFGVRIEEVA